MKIGILVARIGGEDGVALEVDKWIDVLDREGHEVFLLAGKYERCLLEFYGSVHRLVARDNQAHEPLLAFDHPDCLREQELAFLKPTGDESELLELLDKNVAYLTRVIAQWVETNSLDLVISENANAIPLHLSLGMAIRNAALQTGVHVLAHDHDFFWERGTRYVSPYAAVHARMEQAYPLLIPNSSHAVINSAAAAQLLDQYAVSATVVPNVMDFDAPFAFKDSHNQHLLADLGLDPERDIPLLQVTRIIRRKSIETAVALIHAFDDQRMKLVITGSEADGDLEGGDYASFLRSEIARYGVEEQIVYAGKWIETKRGVRPDGSRLYTLSDVYAYGSGCCYFSSYEGFGNAFVEALCAKRPIFVNNYIPVYWPEIGSKGFKTVQIEGGTLTEQAVEDIRTVVLNPSLQQEIGEFNFALGKECFSYDVLADLLADLLKGASELR
jgi:glycosyltransferase involved in cell wall biosynthesis